MTFYTMDLFNQSSEISNPFKNVGSGCFEYWLVYVDDVNTTHVEETLIEVSADDTILTIIHEPLADTPFVPGETKQVKVMAKLKIGGINNYDSIALFPIHIRCQKLLWSFSLTPELNSLLTEGTSLKLTEGELMGLPVTLAFDPDEPKCWNFSELQVSVQNQDPQSTSTITVTHTEQFVDGNSSVFINSQLD